MKKSVIFISISLVLIILLGIGISYAMWNISVSQDTTNMAETKCFDLSITNQENNIFLDNAYPISNDKGKSLTPYTFTVTNTCDITTQYNINLEVLNSSTLSSKFINVMFEGNINLLSSYDPTDKVNTSSIESRKLTTGILKSQESKDYTLRLWIDYNTTLEDLNNEIKTFKFKIVVVGKPINYNGDTVFNFDYTGGEQTFVAPASGTYRLETWGAAGGKNNYSLDNGYGKGGYSVGYMKIEKSNIMYIYVGGVGKSTSDYSGGVGGYNGGGTGGAGANRGYLGGGGGGGATHISLVNGLLYSLESSIENILIVSGGGGGTTGGNRDYDKYTGGSGGGFSGAESKKSSNRGSISNASYQNTGFAFGIGQNGVSSIEDNCGAEGNGGGGGGFYGGFSNQSTGKESNSAGAGGSGYIGNSLLTNKVMYCYDCEESSEESTKTVSTTCSEETPTSYCAKKGNGYARITLVSID